MTTHAQRHAIEVRLDRAAEIAGAVIAGMLLADGARTLRKENGNFVHVLPESRASDIEDEVQDRIRTRFDDAAKTYEIARLAVDRAAKGAKVEFA